MKFEYKVIRSSNNWEIQEARLNEAAAQGWILDKVLNGHGEYVYLYMKREVEPC